MSGCLVLAILISAMAVQAPMASAQIPSVTLGVSVSAGHYILNITVNHVPPPDLSVSHYVNWVNVTLTNSSGEKLVNLTVAGGKLPAAPQNQTFYLSYDMGPLGLNTTVKSKAHCTIHLWGAIDTILAGPPAAEPSEPRNLMAMAGDDYVVLTWSAPSYTGTTAITNYSVYRGSDANSLSEYRILGNVLTFNDTGAVNGNTYFYSVTATNAGGEGVKATVTNATPSAVTPAPAPADNTLLIAAIIVIIIILIVVAAVMMRRRGGKKEDPK